MRRMGTQYGMRRIDCPVESVGQFVLSWMQRIQDGFPCSAWEPEKMSWVSVDALSLTHLLTTDF